LTLSLLLFMLLLLILRALLTPLWNSAHWSSLLSSSCSSSMITVRLGMVADMFIGGTEMFSVIYVFAQPSSSAPEPKKLASRLATNRLTRICASASSCSSGMLSMCFCLILTFNSTSRRWWTCYQTQKSLAFKVEGIEDESSSSSNFMFFITLHITSAISWCCEPFFSY